MGHSKHRHSSKKKDDLSDIIPMSNDENLRKKKKSNNELDDYDGYSDDGSADGSDDGYSDDGSDDDSEDEDEQYERKGKRHDDYDDNEFKAPTVKAKRARLRRGSKYADQEISETRKSAGVQQLSNKLNSPQALHQIQIAIPYGQQDPQRLPANFNGMKNNYELVGPPPIPKKLPFWKKRWFGILLKVLIGICALTIFGVFLYKYLKAMEIIRSRFSSEKDGKSETKEPEPEPVDENTDVLTDKQYESFGNVKSVSGGSSKNSVNTKRQPLPRDARGRFIKRK